MPRTHTPVARPTADTEEGRTAITRRNALVEANQGLVGHVAKMYRDRGHEFDDLCQDAQFALMRAAERYDASTGVPWACYAAVCMRRSLLTVLAARRDHPCLGDEQLAGLPDESPPPPDDGPPELSARVRAGLAWLSPQYRECLTVAFGLDGTPPPGTSRELADAIGTGVYAAELRKHRALVALRRRLVAPDVHFRDGKEGSPKMESCA